MRLKSSNITDKLDIYLAITGVIASVLLIFYSILNFKRYIYLFPGTLSLLVSLAWLIIRKRSSLSFQIKESRSKVVLLSSFSFVLLVISIISFKFRPELYERPFIYFIVTSLMAGSIACQILYSQKYQRIFIIAQIVILGLSIAWSQLLLFPNVVGVDPWYHQMFTRQILELHTIPSTGSYSHLPIFHLLIALASLLTNTSYKIAAMLSVSFVQIICNVIFIYLLANLIFKNHRIGLFASLMVVLGNYHIFMSYWSIPTALAAVYIPIIIYLVWRIDLNSFLIKTSLILLLLFTIILTHTIASMCMAILLFISWLISVVYPILFEKKEATVSVLLPIIFTLAMFGWWMYATGHIKTLTELIHWGLSRDYFFSPTSTEIWTKYVASIPLSEQIFNQFGMFLFFALSFFGIFYMISKPNFKGYMLACIGITPLAIGFFSLISGSSVLEERWWFFAQVLLSIPLGISIGLLYNIFKNSPIKVYGFFIFISLFALILIISPVANVDNPLFSTSSSTRSSLTESELYSIYSISTKYSGQVGTDQYLTCPVSNLPMDLNLVAINKNIYTGDYSNLPQQNILIREYIKYKVFLVDQSLYRLNYDLDQQLERYEYDKTYDSNSITIYSNS